MRKFFLSLSQAPAALAFAALVPAPAAAEPLSDEARRCAIDAAPPGIVAVYHLAAKRAGDAPQPSTEQVDELAALVALCIGQHGLSPDLGEAYFVYTVSRMIREESVAILREGGFDADTIFRLVAEANARKDRDAYRLVMELMASDAKIPDNGDVDTWKIVGALKGAHAEEIAALALLEG